MSLQPSCNVNHERMPVILTQEAEFQRWLNGTTREAYSLVKQYPTEQMYIVQSGPDKRDLLAAQQYKRLPQIEVIAVCHCELKAGHKVVVTSEQSCN